MTNRQKQHLLGYLGYYNIPVDGIWGPGSRKAEETFRRAFAVPEEEETAPALRRAVAEQAPRQETVWTEIRYFRREEFQCTCGGRGCDGFPAEPSGLLLRNAEAVRRHFGRATVVSSGVRCPLRNRELPGSAANSLHMQGRAMDFAVVGVGSAKVLAYVRTLPGVAEAYAIDGNYVHMGVKQEETT